MDKGTGILEPDENKKAETKAPVQPKPKKRWYKRIWIWLPIVFVLLVIFLPSQKKDEAQQQQKQSTITVQDLKDNTITTTESEYTLSFTVPESSLQTTDVYLNGKKRYIPVQNTENSIKTYSGKLPLAFGNNKVKIEASTGVGDKKTAETKEFTITLQASQAPVITVDKAKSDGSRLVYEQTVYKDSLDLLISTTPAESKNSGAYEVTVNDQKAQQSYTNGSFKYTIAIKEGENKFTITATNTAGQTTTELVINRPNSQQLKDQQALTDLLVNAEASCLQYAESYFKVKNVNIHYGQSSIKRKNPDGTVTIKANIADSQGLLRPEKQLGTMECNTSGDGLRVASFKVY